jgi:hypothetical protein
MIKMLHEKFNEKNSHRHSFKLKGCSIHNSEQCFFNRDIYAFYSKIGFFESLATILQ